MIFYEGGIRLSNGEYDLTIYVPTRGRPYNAKRLEHQFYQTSTISSRAVFILSEDDPKLNSYLSADWKVDPIIVKPKKRGFVDPLNMGYWKDRRETYSFAVGFMGDDHFPTTVGWDEAFVNQLLDMKAGLVYGNDKFQEKNVPTQIAMTSDIALTLGFMTLPQLSHLYADDFWLALGQRLGKISYLNDIIIEHLHPAVGKALQDPGYDFSGSYTLDMADKAIYQQYLANDIENDVKKINNMLRRANKL